MKLPSRERAYIPRAKLTNYLLSEIHSAGRSKAKFFRSIGFDEGNIETLLEGLFRIAQNEEVLDVIRSPHGMKYMLDGPLATPSGQQVFIRTIWIVDIGQEYPRFVTAYPS